MTREYDMKKQVYLKESVIAEPLISNWYAWSYLIPPVTAGCNILDRHIKIMESYIRNPEIHRTACEDPEMLGGPFMNLDGKNVEEIQTLLEETKKENHALIKLTEAYKKLDQYIQNHAEGESMEALYKNIPDELKGMVELVYDMNHQPSIRLIEPLIYNKYYDNRNQAISLRENNTDYRKFLLSTPRISEELLIDIPFSSSALDQLFTSKQDPQDFDKLVSFLNIPEEKVESFSTLFTEDKPTKNEDRNFNGNGLRIRYFGHACILIQTREVSILLDPVVSYNYPSETPRYTFADLPDTIDYVVITHNHQDHVLFETLLQIRHKVGQIVVPRTNNGFIADPNLKLILEHVGFRNVREIMEFDRIFFPDGEIRALPFLGEHSDLNIHSKLSYCVKFGSKQFLFAADSNNLDPVLYKNIYDAIGAVDVIFLGMECEGAPLTWLYGPLLPNGIKRSHDNSRTLSGSDCEKATKIIADLGCKEAYVYAMGQEPWLNYIMALDYSAESPQITESDRFIEYCSSQGITSKRPYGCEEWIYN